MDPQQQAAANAQVNPTEPVVEQPAAEVPADNPVTPPDAPVDPQPEQPAVSADQPVQDAQAELQAPEATTPVVDPKQDFLDAYDALCTEKGKQFQYQLSFGVGDDGTFDLTKGILNRLVVDLSSE